MHCNAPWINIHIQVDGNIKPCCGIKEKFNLIQEGFDYLDNKKLIDLRQGLIDNTLHPSCVNCQERYWYDEFVVDSPIPTLFKLKSIDARWSNICNLTCTYCNSDLSSSWANLTNLNIKSSRQYKSEIGNVFDVIKQNLSTIERVSLVGGEPLMAKENIELLTLLPKNVKVEIITNLSINLDNKVYKLLIDRPNVFWYVSMETVGNRFEFVRRGADWSTQVNNLKRLEKDAGPQHVISLQSQFCAYSATNLVELYEFVNSFERVSINWSLDFKKPMALNFYKFPEHLKQKSIDQIEQVKKTIIDHRAGEADKLDQAVIRMQTTSSMQNIVEACINFNNHLESTYFKNKFNFLDLWPQFKG